MLDVRCPRLDEGGEFFQILRRSIRKRISRAKPREAGRPPAPLVPERRKKGGGTREPQRRLLRVSAIAELRGVASMAMCFSPPDMLM